MHRRMTMWRHREKVATCKLLVSEETNPTGTLVLDFQPPELWNNNFLSFKSPSLWCFVTVAFANQYTGRFFPQHPEDSFPPPGLFPISWQTMSLPGTVQVRVAGEKNIKIRASKVLKGRREYTSTLQGLEKEGYWKRRRKVTLWRIHELISSLKAHS